MSKTPKAFGLLLDLGGAPNTWHSVSGVYGMFHPTEPVPVDTLGAPTYAQAEAWDKDPGMPLKLVELSVSDVPVLRDAAAAARKRETRGEEG